MSSEPQTSGVVINAASGDHLPQGRARSRRVSRAARSSHDQTRVLKTILKQQIRMRGLRYQDIADQLGISLITVKRHLNSDRVPLEAIEDIADCLGITLIELAEIAKADARRNTVDLELQQELALAADHRLALVRLLLYSGFTVEDIMDEYDVDEPTIVSLLTRLDRLKLIDLLPGNRVRIHGPRHVEWRVGGPMRHEIDKDIRDHFVKMDFANTEQFFGYEAARLSEASVRQLEEHMKQLVRTVRALHQVDHSLPRESKRWYTMLIARRETNWGFPQRNGALLPPRSIGMDGETYPLPSDLH